MACRCGSVASTSANETGWRGAIHAPTMRETERALRPTKGTGCIAGKACAHGGFVFGEGLTKAVSNCLGRVVAGHAEAVSKRNCGKRVKSRPEADPWHDRARQLCVQSGIAKREYKQRARRRRIARRWLACAHHFPLGATLCPGGACLACREGRLPSRQIGRLPIVCWQVQSGHLSKSIQTDRPNRRRDELEPVYD